MKDEESVCDKIQKPNTLERYSSRSSLLLACIQAGAGTTIDSLHEIQDPSDLALEYYLFLFYL